MPFCQPDSVEALSGLASVQLAFTMQHWTPCCPWHVQYEIQIQSRQLRKLGTFWWACVQPFLYLNAQPLVFIHAMTATCFGGCLAVVIVRQWGRDVLGLLEEYWKRTTRLALATQQRWITHNNTEYGVRTEYSISWCEVRVVIQIYTE